MLAGVLNVSFRWLLTGEGVGVDAPLPPVNDGVSGILTEMRQLRAEISRNAERLGKLEKQLQRALRETA